MHSLLVFHDPATTEIYTLSLHDALPIYRRGALRAHGHRLRAAVAGGAARRLRPRPRPGRARGRDGGRSEEHTSELQSRRDLVCRLLLEKKKNKMTSRLAVLDDDHRDDTH